jgi:hypothetical protein
MYRIDSGRVFWASYEIKGVDLLTFEILNETWAKDSKHVFSAGSRLKGVEPKEFFVLNRIFARDGSRIFFFGGHAKKIAHPSSFGVLDDGEVESSEYLSMPLGYGKDRQNVYFYQETFGAPRPLRGADPESFIVLRFGYAKDAKSVFCRGGRLREADAASFQVLGPHHGTDQRGVFYGEQLIPDAHPRTFEVVRGLCGKDADQVFLRATAIEGADPHSFSLIEGEFLACDRTAVYWHGSPLVGVNPGGFEHLGGSYYRHGVNVFFRGRQLPGADISSFTVLPRLDDAQKRAFWRGELDVPEEAVSGFTAMDAKNVYRSDFAKGR